MKRVFLRVILGLLQTAYIICISIQEKYHKASHFLSELLSFFLGGQEVYTKFRLSRLKKQPKHLILSIYEDFSSDYFKKFSQIVLCLVPTKTSILTLYDAKGNLSNNIPSLLETLQKNIGSVILDRKVFVLSPKNNSNEIIYHIDTNKGGALKEFSMASLNGNILEGKEQPLIINILNPRDNLVDFVQNMKGKDIKLGKIKSELTCNRPLKIFENLGVKMSTQEYDTSLMVSFCETMDSCLGLPFDLLQNSEILFEKRFRDFDQCSLLRIYKKFAGTQQRRGK